jgi:hypothetical protein
MWVLSLGKQVTVVVADMYPPLLWYTNWELDTGRELRRAVFLSDQERAEP